MPDFYTRGGFDWVERYPAVASAVGSLKVQSCFIDGEVVVCDEAGRPSFELLRSRQHDSVAFMYAFDLLALDGQDLRREPLETRKATLASLLRKAPPGIALSEHLEGDGQLVFGHACRLGLEGIVSKRRNSPYKVRHFAELDQEQERGERGGVAGVDRGLGPVTLVLLTLR